MHSGSLWLSNDGRKQVLDLFHVSVESSYQSAEVRFNGLWLLRSIVLFRGYVVDQQSYERSHILILEINV